jgi:hypothetical protein
VPLPGVRKGPEGPHRRPLEKKQGRREGPGRAGPARWLPQLVPRIRQLRHPRPRRPAHRRRLKPVQRRVLHTLWDMDDGRFHKVANVVGATMKLPPARRRLHRRGAGPSASAAGSSSPRATTATADRRRRRGAPLHRGAPDPFAKDVLFNPKTTTWQLSYDGRNREPVTLPAKFPIVLLEGAEGIAVGLSTKILPHNFNDLCRAAINHLQGKPSASFRTSRPAAPPTSPNTTTASAAAR